MKQLTSILIFLAFAFVSNAQDKDRTIQDVNKNFEKSFSERITSQDIKNSLNRVISFADSARFKGYTMSQIKALKSSVVTTSGTIYSNEEGKHGFWKYDPNDNTTADNVGTVWVTNSGLRLKRIIDDYVYPEWFGAVGNGTTNDLEALRKAITYSSQNGYICLLRKKYYVALTTENSPIELLSNTKIEFTKDAELKYDFFGLPVFWAMGRSNIKITGGTYTFAGTLTTALPAVTATFNTQKIKASYPSGSFPDRDVQAMITVVNCTDVQLSGMNMYSAGATNTTMMNKPISVAYSSRVTIRDLYIDAAHWGCLAWAVSYFTFENVKQRMHGQLQTSVYTWEAPAHVLYVPNFAGNGFVTCRNITDLGIEVAGTSNEGANSVKIFAPNSVVENIFSSRPQGILDFGGDDSSVKNLHWYGENVPLAKIDLAGVMRTLNLSTNRSTFTDIFLNRPYTDNTGGDVFVYFSSNCTDCIIDMNIRSSGTQNPSNPVCIFNNLVNSKLNIYFDAKNFTVTPTLVRLDGSCTNNHIVTDFMCNTASVNARVVEQSKTTSGDNQLMFRHLFTGKETYSGTGAFQLNHVSQELTVSGNTATLTASNLLPKGAILVSLTTIVTTALDATTGLTGYQVGDGSDADRWGAKTGVVVATNTGNADWTASTIECFTSAKSVVITAVGGNFSTSGKILIRASYINSAIDTDNY